MGTREELSFCRQCMGHCGVVVTVDDDDRIVSIRADRDDPQTLGYACFKGLKADEAHNSPDRILHPLKRQPDGSFQKIRLETALDEIGAKLQAILATDGPEAVAGYRGGGGSFTSSAALLLNDFLAAVGSPKIFSSVTIDQSSKTVAMGRIGIWPAGRDSFSRGDVHLLFGANPLVSVSAFGFDTRNPQKRLRDAKARGMKLIVIDPRRTETARQADVFLQPLPGEDCSIAAGLVHIVLERGWHDREFCDRYADDVEALRLAVARFTPAYVAARARVPEAKLIEVAEVFARDATRGAASSATGPDMASHPNLAEHLIECLNVICGRFLREGERIDNPGVIGRRRTKKAEVIPAPRWWERSYTSRLHYGLVAGELPTATLPDEILTPGPGRVRALIVHGGNPVSSIPDQHKVVRACEALDLLVTIEPFMTATAELSDYILPSTLPYERPDLPLIGFEDLVTPAPYTRYTPAVAKPPAGSEVRDDPYFFWALAQRLGVELVYRGVPLDGDRPPETDELLAITARHAPIDFEELKAAERGVYAEGEPQLVAPGDPDSPHRFSLLPPDVAAELEEVVAQRDARGAELGDGERFAYRLAVRRLRDGLNSAGLELPSIKQRLPYNPAYMNPDDMKAEGLGDGDEVTIRSAHGAIRARAAGDPDVRTGVVSMAHGFGGLPGRDGGYDVRGVNTNLLISLESDRATINAMPRMTGIPIQVLGDS